MGYQTVLPQFPLIIPTLQIRKLSLWRVHWTCPRSHGGECQSREINPSNFISEPSLLSTVLPFPRPMGQVQDLALKRRLKVTCQRPDINLKIRSRMINKRQSQILRIRCRRVIRVWVWPKRSQNGTVTRDRHRWPQLILRSWGRCVLCMWQENSRSR